MQLTKNFYKTEFESNDGATMPDGVFENIKELANNLQIIRDYIEEPLTVTSGYRSPEHNLKVGGVPNSQHLLGKAADLIAKDLTSKQLSRIIEKLTVQGQIAEGGIGLYNGFVHYDIRGARKRWNYSTRYRDFYK
ncbi:YcbK family protein [Flagellimonas sp.]|uniref:YcbK family protein n=1 Tax=Flagellimonas sp. TaxID=2058762 RepID=UPI003B59D3FC